MSNRRESGMTLIEVVVGLALLGMLTAALVAAFGAGLSGSRLSRLRAERSIGLHGTHATLRQALGRARPVRWVRNNKSIVAFDGASDGVSFIASFPSWPSAGGLYLSRIVLEKGDLVIIRRLTSGEENTFSFPDDSERLVLANKLRAVRFAYFGTASGERAPGWRSSWTNRTRLPDLIRIEFSRTVGPAWPDLVAHLVIGRQPR